MEVFISLFLKLLPLYLLMIAGYVVTKRTKVDQRAIAPYIVYIILPVIVFDTMYSLEFTPANIILPLLIWGVASIIAIVWFVIAKYLWKEDGTEHIAGFAAGGSNFGYFGVPVALLLFGEEIRSTAVLFLLAYMLFENTIGYSLIYPNETTFKERLVKIIRLPSLYALLLGGLVNIAGWQLPDFYGEFVGNMYGAFIILGTLLVGIGFSALKKSDADFWFVGYMMVAKFLVWPAAIGLLIWFDITVLNLFSPTTHTVIFLMSLVPIAANTVTYASLLKIKPGEAALVVVVSTVIALIYIPFMLSLFSVGG